MEHHASDWSAQCPKEYQTSEWYVQCSKEHHASEDCCWSCTPYGLLHSPGEGKEFSAPPFPWRHYYQAHPNSHGGITVRLTPKRWKPFFQAKGYLNLNTFGTRVRAHNLPEVSHPSIKKSREVMHNLFSLSFSNLKDIPSRSILKSACCIELLRIIAHISQIKPNILK